MTIDHIMLLIEGEISLICFSTCVKLRPVGQVLAQNVIMIGLRYRIRCALELAHGLCYIMYFKFNFSCLCNIKI